MKNLPTLSPSHNPKPTASKIQPVNTSQPLTSLSLNDHIRRTRRASIANRGIDPRVLDDDPYYDEDAEPDDTPALTRGLFTFNTYILKQTAHTLSLNCDPRVVYPLRSASIPRAWIPYLNSVSPRPDRTRLPRDYYPLPCQQAQFDEWEATHPTGVWPGMHTFNLCTIPSYWDDELPPVSLPYLIVSAISGSPSAKLTEREIKLALIRRFSYFAERLARNSRWQISVNWVLNKYACFERVSREATPEDDGCAYQAWSLPTFQTLIYPEESNPAPVPIHVFFPIDYGESAVDLSLKPTRPARRLRQTVLVEIDSPDSSNHSNEECLVWSPAPTLTTLSSEDMDIRVRDNMEWHEEFSLGFFQDADQWTSILASHLSAEGMVRLKDAWPKDIPPPWDTTAPSLWIQAALLQSVKLGSDEQARAHLREKIIKAQQRFFDIVNSVN